MNRHDGTGLYCDCCGREKLAEIHPGECLEIVDRRHSIRHTVSLLPRELLERLAGTLEATAVVSFVRQLFV